MKKIFHYYIFSSIFMFSFGSEALYVEPEIIPAERLIKNLNNFLAENPDDADAHYTLGRLHYTVFINNVEIVKAYRGQFDPGEHLYFDRRTFGFSYAGVEEEKRRKGYLNDLEKEIDEYEIISGELKKLEVELAKPINLDSLEEKQKQLNQQQEYAERFGYVEKTKYYYERAKRLHGKLKTLNEFDVLNPDELDAHALKAAEHLVRAIQLNNDKPLYYLTLGSFLSQYKEQEDTKASGKVGILGEVKEDTIRTFLYTAFRMSYRVELKLATEFKGDFDLNYSIASEAGRIYTSIVSEKDLGKSKIRRRVETIEKFNEGFKKVIMGHYITPIIFSFDSHTSIDELLAPTTHVLFDLDGDTRSELWSWLNPSTALLVWDPEHTGEITSGRQLFGTATWWLLFSDGYRALAALDDNQDCVLSGDELEGIAAWFDENSDGVSQPGEVKSLNDLGIVSIATSAMGETQGMLMNKQGITLDDGQILPSYDWVTSPIENETSLPLRLH